MVVREKVKPVGRQISHLGHRRSAVTSVDKPSWQPDESTVTMKGISTHHNASEACHQSNSQLSSTGENPCLQSQTWGCATCRKGEINLCYSSIMMAFYKIAYRPCSRACLQKSNTAFRKCRTIFYMNLEQIASILVSGETDFEPLGTAAAYT